MLPTLFQLGPLAIQGYGLMIGLGILTSFWLVVSEARRRNMPRLDEQVVPLFFWVAGAAFVGGKIAFAMAYSDEFQRIRTTEGLLATLGQGFVFYGSLLLALPVMLWRLRVYGLPIVQSMDILILCGPVVHGLGRVGCFLAGCCFGTRTSGGLSVCFPAGHDRAGIPLHPVQLYEAGGELVIFLILWFGVRLHARFPGQVVLSYLLLYAVLRFTTEFFRGDHNPAALGLSLGQWVSLALAVLAVPAFLVARSHARPLGG